VRADIAGTAGDVNGWAAAAHRWCVPLVSVDRLPFGNE
jgi:hypothetical protein